MNTADRSSPHYYHHCRRRRRCHRGQQEIVNLRATNPIPPPVHDPSPPNWHGIDSTRMDSRLIQIPPSPHYPVLSFNSPMSHALEPLRFYTTSLHFPICFFLFCVKAMLDRLRLFPCVFPFHISAAAFAYSCAETDHRMRSADYDLFCAPWAP